MSGHTEGRRPWRLSLPDDTCILDADGGEVCRMAGDYEDEERWPIMEANALAIVRAVNAEQSAQSIYESAVDGRRDFRAAYRRQRELTTELLEACKAQENLWQFAGDDARPEIKRVQELRRAAISKATGHASSPPVPVSFSEGRSELRESGTKLREQTATFAKGNPQ